jgi:Mg/Co/Ni transporter MgtE
VEHGGDEQGGGQLEEMEADELESLLREAPTGQAAELLAEMEPDEASEALREIPDDDRERLLGAINRAGRPAAPAAGLRRGNSGR